MDPEVRTLESGVKVARVRLATTETIVDRQTNERRELTEWHTISLWRGLADVADKYVRKGSQLYIEGSLHTREWTDRENVKHYTTEITANEMKLLGRRPEGAAAQPSAPQSAAPAQPVYAAPVQTPAPAPAPAPAPVIPNDNPDDLPF